MNVPQQSVPSIKGGKHNYRRLLLACSVLGDEPPSQAVLTVTTNEDLFPGPEVSVAFGKLTDKEMK